MAKLRNPQHTINYPFGALYLMDMQNNLTKLEIALQSPAFWSIVALAAYNILAFLVPQLSGTIQIIANIILMALAAYLHPSEVQKAGSVK